MVDFDKLNHKKKDANNAETSPDVPIQETSKNGIYRTCFDTKISIYEAGSFIPPGKTEKQTFEAGIKIKAPDMKVASKMSARSLIAIYFLIKDDELVRSELKRRAAIEKGQEKELD